METQNTNSATLHCVTFYFTSSPYISFKHILQNGGWRREEELFYVVDFRNSNFSYASTSLAIR